MGTSTCKSCGKPIHWIRTRSGRSMPCDTRPHKARRQHKAGNACRGRDKLRNSGRSSRGSGLGLYATLEHLQRAGHIQEGGKEMTALNILLGVVAAVLLIGVLGEKNNQRHQSIVIAFVAVIALIICMSTIF